MHEFVWRPASPIIDGQTMKKLFDYLRSNYLEVAGLTIGTFVVLHLISSVNQADLQVFIRAGRSVVEGQSPYPKLGTTSVYAGNSFVYPYLVAVAFAPLSLLGTYWGPFVFEIISLAALFYAIYTFSLSLRSRVSDTVVMKISIFAVVLLASPTLISLQMGTLTPLILAGLALMWKHRDSATISSLLVVVLTFTKVYLVVLGLFFILCRRFAAVVGTLLFGFVGLVLNFSTSPLGPIGYFHLLSQLARHESRQGFSFINALHSVYVSKVGAYVILALGMATILALWWRSSSLAERVDLAFIISIASTLTATPILWSSYLPVLFIPLLLLVDNFAIMAALSYAASVMVTPDRAGTLLIALQFLAITLIVLPCYISKIMSTTRDRLLVGIDISKVMFVGFLSIGFVVELLSPALGVQLLMVGVSAALMIRRRTTSFGSQEVTGDVR